MQIDYGQVCFNEPVKTSVYYSSKNPGPKFLVTSVYISNSEVNLRRLTNGEYDLSDPQLLWLKLKPKIFNCMPLFSVECLFEQLPVEAFPEDSVYPLLGFYSSVPSKKIKLIAQIAIKVVQPIDIKVERVNLPESTSVGHGTTSIQLVGEYKFPYGKIILISVESIPN
jgi:hypothetical protein